MKIHATIHQLICVCLSFLIVLEPGLVAMAQDRPIAVDPQAPASKSPTMDNAGNGVPIEQIATPDKNGVSHNLFTDFNVNKIGLIINNSQSTAQSQLGGFILANPNLKSGEAKLILNEVTGANRSHLEGYTELHGGQADYILANPNGITVNGGGFINFPKVTLTTGQSRFGAEGLEGIDVRTGDILVEGDGINAANVDAFTLLARVTKINADIHAKDLAITSGQNTYSPADGSITVLASDGSAIPSVGIDSSALGGMYANRIVLQGTEAGVGVNLTGIAQAANAFELTADGLIRLKSKVTAGNTLQVQSLNEDVFVENTVYSGDAAQFNAAGTLDIHSDVSGEAPVVAAGRQLTLSGSRVTTEEATITAGLQSDGQVVGGSLSVSASEQLNTVDSKLASGDSISLASSDITLEGGQVEAVDSLTIQGATPDTGDVAVIGAAELSSLNTLTITANSLTVENGSVEANNLSLWLSGNIDLSDATLNSTEFLSIEAAQLANGLGGTISSFDDMTLTLDTLQNNGGLIYAGDLLDLNLLQLRNTASGYIIGVNGVDIGGQSAGSRADLVYNNQSVIESLAGDIHLAANSVKNISGAATVTRREIGWDYFNLGLPSPVPAFKSDGTRNVYYGETGFHENKSGVNARLDYTLNKYGIPWNRPYDGRVLQEWIHTSEEVITALPITAEILSAGDMTFEADSILNQQGLISSGGNLIINANSLINQGLELSRYVDVYRNFHQVRQGGSRSYGQHQHEYHITQVIDSIPAVVAAAGTLTVNVPGYVANQSVKEGEAYTGKFAGSAAYTGLEVSGPAQDPATGEPVNTVTVSLPTGIGSLYVVNQNPEHAYLIETNPALTNAGIFYGSQYFFSRVGVNVLDLGTQMLGDAFFETNMIRQQVLEATGKRYLNPSYTSDADQLRQLMDNAAQAYADLDLQIGAALSSEQLAGLTQDIVWYETREVMGQEVLVPVLYMGSLSRENLALTRGAMLTGETVGIQTAQLGNSGAIVGQNVTLQADDVINLGGDLIGETLDVTASNDIVNKSGSISGGDITLAAGRDVIIETQTEQRDDGKDTHGYIHQTANVTASGDLTISSGRDVSIAAADLSATGTASIVAGQDVTIGTKKLTEHIEATRYEATRTGHMASSIQAGDLSIKSGGDVSVAGSALAADNDILVEAEENVSIAGVTNSYQSHYEHNRKGSFLGGNGSSVRHAEEDRIGQSSLTAGGNVTVTAGADMTLQASKVLAGEDVALTAVDGDVLIASGEESSNHFSLSNHSGFMGMGSMDLQDTRETTSVGSEITGGGKVVLEARGDVTLQAARLESGKETEIIAQEGRVLLLATKDSKYDQTISSENGLMRSYRDEGTNDETLQYTHIVAGQGLTITTPQGIVVEIKANGDVLFEETGDVRQDAQVLAQVPGLEWMGDLLERDDVDWQRVQEIHDSWKHESHGLGAGAMLIIAIAASVVTAGAASALAAAAMGATVVNGALMVGGVAATSTQVAVHAALSAAIVSLSSKVAVSVADAAAGGDLKQNLENNIFSEDGARSIATSMVLSGVLSTTASDFAQYGEAGEAVATAAVKAATYSIVGGESLEDACLSAVGSAFTSYLEGKITAAELDATVSLVLDGVAGAAGSAIAGGDPVQGAMSSMVASIAASIRAPELTAKQKKEDGPLAELSGCVYGTCEGVGNYKPLSTTNVDDFCAVNAGECNSLHNVLASLDDSENSGFYAQVFRNEDTREIVVAFRGSESDANDWSTNIEQAVGGIGGQYENLKTQMTALSNYAKADGYQLVATGHSLGGGLATAAASTGLINKAVVFNPAGVHSNTIKAVGGEDGFRNVQNVTAYSSRADILSNIQDLLGFVAPTAYGTRVLVDGAGFHGKDAVIEAFKDN